jgi:hypothetical protein
MSLSRFVLREDGTVLPITPGGLMDQPNWHMDAMARYHASYVRAKKEKRKK